jgi:hypothetical protein
MDAVARFADIYNRLNERTIDLIDTVYAPGIVFEDPFRRIEGREALHAYFAHLYEGVARIRFDFEAPVAQADRAALAWTMTVRLKRFCPDRDIAVRGASLLLVEGDMITRHRDYFDPGELVYEHVPVLGSVVRRIKRRM